MTPDPKGPAMTDQSGGLLARQLDAACKIDTLSAERRIYLDPEQRALAIDALLAATSPLAIAEGVTCIAKPLTDAERKDGIEKWATQPAITLATGAAS